MFRYALLNWAPAPHVIFYLHHGQPDEQDREVNKMLAELADARQPQTNIFLEQVDVSQDEALKRYPKRVEELWTPHDDGENPVHLVITPWGTELFAGRLDAETVTAMIGSPVRRQLGKLISEGNAAVLLILESGDQQKDRQAEKAAKEVLAMADKGEIPMAGVMGAGGFPGQFVPGDPNNPAAGPEDAPDDTLKLAVLRLSRTDPAEKWLVRCLLSIEPDLGEFADEPMVFTVFGRGRAMPPYVGKGIVAENLADCVAFLAGACSCTVKAQNPGADLPMCWDWDSTAEALAEQYADIGRGPWGYQEFAPEEPEEAAAAEDQDGAIVGTPTLPAFGALAAAGEILQPKAPAEPPPAPVAEAERKSEPKTVIPTGRRRGQLRRTNDSFTARQAWQVGAGLAVAAAVVLVAGLVLVRRHRPG